MCSYPKIPFFTERETFYLTVLYTYPDNAHHRICQFVLTAYSFIFVHWTTFRMRWLGYVLDELFSNQMLAYIT